MKSVGLGACLIPRAVSRFGVLAAAALCVAAQVALADAPLGQCTAETAAPAATPAAWSRPVEAELGIDWSFIAFRGLSCERCNPAIHFCVVNPVRYEYACAPLGSTACWSSERTAWCPPGRSCWAGHCR